MTLTERAISKLNDIALTIHYKDFQRRMDRLILRVIGGR